MDAGPAAAAHDPLLGRTIMGKYRLLELLGSGAMGTIYKAEQTNLAKQVVIKLLHSHLLADPELTQRFHREAHAASRLNHPNCVQIIDFGQTEDGSLFIAMEYIPGDDLATLLEQQFPIDLRRLVHIFKQVCVALDEAHANGVLHRDLKPENIMVADRRNEPDFVKVVDFGIAKLEDNNPGSKRSFRTRTGIVCGTPEYMSPEQARGKPLDARSDIYALGIALYHLTTDRLPFDAPSPVEIVTKHLTEVPVPPRTYRADLPEAFERLILTMMAKDREQRPTGVMDVHAELERIDRELASERNEPIEHKSYGDATVIDLHPSELLSAALLDELDDDPRDAPTQETTAREIYAPRDRPPSHVHGASIPLAREREMLDTLPESGTGAIEGARVASATHEHASRATPSIARRPPAGLPRVAGDQGFGRRETELLFRGMVRGRPARERDAHEAALGEQITLDIPPAPGPAVEVAERPRGAAPAELGARTSRGLKPRRRTALWVVVALGVASVLGLGAWLVATAF